MSYSQNDSLKTKNELFHIDKDTKFGLVLSGGGAKGFAHIGILKIIDSLNIKVDYITGTSMGGILAGLYSMGYKGEELKKIIYKTDWNRVLSNRIPYNKINIEEKDEYDKYIFEFPLNKGIPTLPSSYIEGQYMSEILNTHTFPSKHINDFSKLRIPVELTTSDIINGGLIMQKKGSLPLAIRASLAIPAAFAPVYIDGQLLVDGGLERNFPVKEVKKMGANFIIGGYTGSRLFTEKEVQNPIKMIYQTHAFRSVDDFKEQKKTVNIMVDFVAALDSFTSADFKKYKEIIKVGEELAKKHLPEFLALAEAQKKLGFKYEHTLIEEQKIPTIRITYSEDNGVALSNISEIKTIESLLNLKIGEYHDSKAVNQAIDRVFGTRLYDKVYYSYTHSEQGLIMNIFVKKSKEGAFKVAPHYDNEQSIGIIVNYTYRNLLFNKSRIITTLDLAENLKTKIHFQKFIDYDNKWWLNTEVKFNVQKNNDFLLKIIDVSDNIYTSNYITKNLKSNLALNYNVNTNTTFSLGAEHLWEKIENKVAKSDEFLLGQLQENLFSHQNFALFFTINQNNLNKRFYTTKGNHFMLNLKFAFQHQYKLYDFKDTQPILYSVLNPESSEFQKYNQLLSLTVNENFAIPINKFLALKINAFLGMHLGKNTSDKTPYLFLNQKYYLGGSEYNFTFMNPEFHGFKQEEASVTSLFKTNTELQFKIMNNLYLSPSFHYATISDYLNPFDLKKIKENYNVYGMGINLGYESLIGPINLNVSKNNFLNFWKLYFSIGYKF